MLSEEARHKSSNIVGFHLYDLSRISKSIEAESIFVVSRGCEEGAMGSDYLMSVGALLGC